eukprot:COSAG06_NODE_4082_length_4593_cov_4.561638_2_plen_68_part_00
MTFRSTSSVGAETFDRANTTRTRTNEPTQDARGRASLPPRSGTPGLTGLCIHLEPGDTSWSPEIRAV